jgi:DNA invertase Pin-like site-specific DNA recombinase
VDFGYARSSTTDQDYARQVEALEAEGVNKFYSEKISGARADRPQLAELMAALKSGDVVCVTMLDRLGRSTRELLDRIGRPAQVSARLATSCVTRPHRRAGCSRPLSPVRARTD